MWFQFNLKDAKRQYVHDFNRVLWVPNHYHKTCELMLQLVWVDTVEKQIHHVFNQYFEDIFIRTFYDLSKVFIIELVYWDIFCCKLVVYELHFLEKGWIKTRKKCLRQFGFLNFFLTEKDYIIDLKPLYFCLIHALIVLLLALKCDSVTVSLCVRWLISDQQGWKRSGFSCKPCFHFDIHPFKEPETLSDFHT